MISFRFGIILVALLCTFLACLSLGLGSLCLIESPTWFTWTLKAVFVDRCLSVLFLNQFSQLAFTQLVDNFYIRIPCRWRRLGSTTRLGTAALWAGGSPSSRCLLQMATALVCSPRHSPWCNCLSSASTSGVKVTHLPTTRHRLTQDVSSTPACCIDRVSLKTPRSQWSYRWRCHLEHQRSPYEQRQTCVLVYVCVFSWKTPIYRTWVIHVISSHTGFIHRLDRRSLTFLSFAVFICPYAKDSYIN